MKKTVLMVGLLLLVGMPVFGTNATPAVPAPESTVVVQDAAPVAPAAPVLPDSPVAPIAAAASCYQQNQACIAGCGSNSACLFNCRLRYEACRYY
jgi:hypothetical protein